MIVWTFAVRSCEAASQYCNGMGTDTTHFLWHSFPAAPSRGRRRTAVRTAAPQPRGAARCVANAAMLGSRQGQSARRAADRFAPHRIAWEQLPALASRGPLARWSGSVAGRRRQGNDAYSCLAQVWVVCGRCPLSEGHYAPSGFPLAPALRAAKGVRPSALSPSPPGAFQGVRPARRLARPTRQSTRLSPACQCGQQNGQCSWPRCQLRL
jgi:hypothetical protein